MMQFKQQVFLIVAAIIALTSVFYKHILLQTHDHNHKLYVTCTTTIIADAITHIAQDKINLNILMGPGVDPHLYKPIEQDITKIAQADIIFYNGLHLEARMTDLFEQMSTTKTTVAVCQDIPKEMLIASPEHHNYFDPHIWFDPKIWSYAIETISEVLKRHDRANKDFYEKNTKLYLQNIQNMYQETQNLMLTIPKEQRILITAHDAFEYFAQAYHCKVVSLQGISTASEAGTKDVQELSNFILEHQIPAIFIETSIPQRTLQAVQQNVASKGFNVRIGQELYSDALGTKGTKQGTYIGMMNYNIATIVHDLKS